MNWTSIPNFSRYQISDDGQIRRTRTQKLLHIQVNDKGYFTVRLYDDSNIRKSPTIHRLLALIFIPNPDKKPFINHIKQNNKIENLEWCTHQENITHAYANSLVPPPLKGGDNKMSIKIGQFSISGEFIRTFNGVHDAARITGGSGNKHF